MNMTAPVITQITPGKEVYMYTVSFYIPKKNQQTPPLADDLHVQSWKPTYVAVRQIGGYVTDDLAIKEAVALMDSLKGTEWKLHIEKSKGNSPAYLVADYNPPFQTTARVNEFWFRLTCSEVTPSQSSLSGQNLMLVPLVSSQE